MVTLEVQVHDPHRADPQAMLKAMRKVQVVLLEGEKKIFDAEGPGWAPLKPATIRRRRKGRATFGGIGIRKLRDTGLMHGSVTALTHPRGHRVATTDRAEVGTNLQRAHFHQEGTRRMPARPFMRIRQEDVPTIEAIIADGFMDTLGRSA